MADLTGAASDADGPQLECQVEHDDSLTIRLRGELDMATAPVLRACAAEATRARQADRRVLDLSELTFSMRPGCARSSPSTRSWPRPVP